MPKRVSEDVRRVPLNCLVLPETRDWLRAQNGSQGEMVDAAVRCLMAGAQMQPQSGVALRPKNKKQRVEQELAASDLTAQIVERDDIEYGHHDPQPRGEHVANLGWRGNKNPLLKPSEKGKK